MNTGLFVKRLLSFLFMLIIMATIFSFSMQPAETSAEVSTSITESIVTVLVPVPPFTQDDRDNIVDMLHGKVRKCAHFFLFSLLGMSSFVFFRSFWTPRISAPAALVLSALYASTDELHQLFVKGRGAQVSDVILDSCGALFGIAFVLLCTWLLKRSQDRKKAASDMQN